MKRSCPLLALALASALSCFPGSAPGAENGDLLPIPDKLVVLSFDDGNKSDRAFVADVLEKHSFGATFYVTEGLGFLKNKQNYVTWDEIRELYEMGFEIGNHSQAHRSVTSLNREQLAASIAHIDERCAQHSIPKPVTFCYPGFSHHQRAVEVLAEREFLFARRGVRPEFNDGGRGSRGPAYDPDVDHPLLVPTTWYSGPESGFDDLKWAVQQARDGKIAVLCFHGVPALEHPWVHTNPEDFKAYMQFLEDEGCRVIAMRDLAQYVDPNKRPADPYAQIKARAAQPQSLRAIPVPNALGLELNEVAYRWEIADGAGRQSAYQILVASDEKKLAADAGDLWDSGRRFSNQHTGILHRGRAFKPGSTLWWKVRIWRGRSDDPGPFSQPAKYHVPAAAAGAKQRKRSAEAADGKPQFVTGKLGQAILLGNGKPGIRIPDYADLRPTSGTTISAWIQPRKVTDSWQIIFRKEDGNHRRLLAIGKEGPFWGLWAGLGFRDGYREAGASLEPDQLVDGNWHHVAASVDGKHLRLFLDGKMIREREERGALGSGGDAPAYVGSYSGNDEIFQGAVDDLRIYSRGLGKERMAKLAGGEGSVAEEAIVAHLKFDGNLDNESTFTPPVARNRIVLIGGTLISRMEEHAYLETAITARWPHRDITFRNLGWPADDVFGTARGEFGSAHNTRSWRPPGAEGGFGYEEMLKQVARANPDTMIVGYGSETAFSRSDEEFQQFIKAYVRLITELENTGAHLILLSPPRQEKFGPVNPNPAERNRWLARAAKFIQTTATARGHTFIDLFTHLVPPAGTAVRLTENGVHLHEDGYRLLAQVFLRQLALVPRSLTAQFEAGGLPLHIRAGQFGNLTRTNRGFRFDIQADVLPDPVSASIAPGAIRIQSEENDPATLLLKIDGGDDRPFRKSPGQKGTLSAVLDAGPDHRQVEELRQTIMEKNRLHRYRIRPLNKAYIFLFRRHEMGHLAYEMEDLDRLVAEKEERIARLRQPQSHRYEVERVEAWRSPRKYPDHEVPKVIPDPDTDGERKAFTIADGFEINLFAANPMISNPINLNWDARGRAWVATSSTYPHVKPGGVPNDRIVILEDTDLDGIADKSTLFADGLFVPHSVMPVQGGAYVCSTTEFLFLADHDGDDRADERRVVYSGFGNADVHHMIHGLRWAPWGDLHFIQSIYINSFVETPWGNRRLNGSGIWKFRPETERLDVFARGMVNPWGLAFDYWGQSFATDGAGGSGPHYVFPGAAFRSAVGAARVIDGLIPGKPKNTAAEFVSGRHLPETWHGSLLANDFRANRTVRYELAESGSGYKAKEVETVLHSSHRAYRPADIKMGPDGAVYIVDWYNAIIDHGEVDFHHPQRDKSHGRIWRLTAKGRPLVERPQIEGAPAEDLLDLLQAPEQWTRLQAKRELVRHGSQACASQLRRWTQALDPAHPAYDHHRLEALWLCGAFGLVDEKLHHQVLSSSDPRARAAGVRMISTWLDRLRDPMAMLEKAVSDDHPRVRLEAVNALRQAGTLPAANLALRALDFPVDGSLDYALWLTARELQDEWLPALQSGRAVFDARPDRVAFALKAANNPLALASLVDLVQRGEVSAAERKNALRMIAALGGAGELEMVLEIATKDSDPDLLRALAEAPMSNTAVPKNAGIVVDLLTHHHAGVRTSAAGLVGRWKIPTQRHLLMNLARAAEAKPDERLAASNALAQLGDTVALKELAFEGRISAIRATATAAWAAADPHQAAAAAATLLAELKSHAEAELIFHAYTERQDSPDILAEALALAGVEIDAELAATGIRIAQGSGRDLTKLVDALAAAGSLPQVGLDISDTERRELLAAAVAHGDATRGEGIYQRAALLCTTCHAIDGTGGKLGPDLTSLGAYMTPESILESLLNPSTDIKQGYETVIVTRKNGTLVSGTLQRKSDAAALIRDPSGQVVSVPDGEIAKMDTSPISLMPPGLTASLRRDQLVDLMRYLTSLGKKD